MSQCTGCYTMFLAGIYVMVAALAAVVAGDLDPPEKHYKILVLLPVSSQSHKNVFIPLAEALADRGHQVTMLSNSPKSTNHPNITDISHGLQHFQNINMFEYKDDWTTGFTMFEKVLPVIARDFYKVPLVKELYERRKEFDLFIVDHAFNEVVYPFLHQAPFIMVSTPGTDYRQSAVLGNVMNPAYVPSQSLDFSRPYSIWHRFLNTLIHIAFAVYWRNWNIVPQLQKEISAQFPELPPLLELERNMSLALMNTHFSIGIPLPLLPSQVEVGAMHCRPANPLPQELESWITGAGSSGVIYFNLGSFSRGSYMPVQYRDVFLQAFRRLPQRVVWKYEGELKNVPDNVMITNWVPQQDILAHNNVKVFITHCGLLGTQESIYHATPLLGLPIFADQNRNSMFIRNSGVGDFLLWEELTEDVIVNAINDIINNPKYKDNILRKSKLMRDQPVSPTELAVFWTEYVIRHKGAPQLRSPAAQLSWVEFLMLDVIFLLHLTVFFLYFITRRILRVIYAKIFSANDSIKKKRE
ncbi:UDP-glycosyltransferase UGT5-like isoform X1 [Cherax quadricarinatus]